MNRPLKIPYAIGNFEEIKEQGYFYIDKTHYIEALESYKAQDTRLAYVQTSVMYLGRFRSCLYKRMR